MYPNTELPLPPPHQPKSNSSHSCCAGAGTHGLLHTTGKATIGPAKVSSTQVPLLLQSFFV